MLSSQKKPTRNKHVMLFVNTFWSILLKVRYIHVPLVADFVVFFAPALPGVENVKMYDTAIFDESNL